MEKPARHALQPAEALAPRSSAEVARHEPVRNETAIDPADLRSVFRYWAGSFLRRGLEQWRRGHWFRALGLWVSLLVAGGVPPVIMTWALPIHLEISRGLRQLVYRELHIRPPFGDFYPYASLTTNFTIIDPSTGKSRPVIDGMLCYPHEIISVSVKIEEPTNLLIFGFDRHQPYRMTNSPLTVQNKAPGEFSNAVQLDTAPGYETIYVIASSLPFDFERDVRPALAAMVSSSRGGTPTHTALPLPSRLQQQAFTCQHMN